jgi:anaerobic magnesium-protoporphyrin IX monomethyl ester cyclase
LALTHHDQQRRHGGSVLLVNASVRAPSRHARLSPPLGLAYIAGVLLAHGYDVAAEDCNLTDFNPARLRGRIEDLRPRMVGISASTETYPNALEIASIAKRANPSIAVVIGGPHASVMHRQAAAEPDIDVVVRGEGEHTMLALADCLASGVGSLTAIAGITYVADGRVAATGDRPAISDPDALPLPARDLFPLPMYEQPASVLTSRGGCPCDCVFCAVNNIWKGRRRFRSADDVVREVELLVERYGCDEISFADDTFTLSRRHATSLCDRLLPAGAGGLLCEWRCTTRVDMVDHDLLDTMRRAGCRSIAYGVESGSPRILESLGKRITRAHVLHAVAASLDLGMEVLCSFMFPHPDDTEDTIRQQTEFMNTLVNMGATVSLALTTPFPGTAYYENANALGIRILTDRLDEFDGKHLVIATRHLSEERLRSLLADLQRDVGLQSDTLRAF